MGVGGWGLRVSGFGVSGFGCGTVGFEYRVSGFKVAMKMSTVNKPRCRVSGFEKDPEHITDRNHPEFPYAKTFRVQDLGFGNSKWDLRGSG